MRNAWLLCVGPTALLVSMAACDGPSTSPSLPEIMSESEEGGFCDLVFRAPGPVRQADGTLPFRAHGLDQGRSVGLEVALGSAWTEVSLGSGLPPAFQGTVELRSIGHDSDALLIAMDRLFETALHPAAMTAAAKFSAITLEGDPRDPARGPVKIKLFYEPGDEEGYAELYVNLDVRAGRLYVNEKDPDYRAALIKALTASRDDR